MRELSVKEVEEVNGGVVPFILAVVAIDAGLLATMWSHAMSNPQQYS